MSSASKRRALLVISITLVMLAGLAPAARTAERVKAVAAPLHPLPPEEKSAKIARFSFILYGDTRSGQDGLGLQSDHSRVVEGILAEIKTLRNTDSPVRFILQTGDAVVRGETVREWNVSYIPLVDRLVQTGGLPYFFVPGNHDISSPGLGDVLVRKTRLQNVLDAFRYQIPPDGSPRRLAGSPAYAFGYGNTFVLGFDSVNAGEDQQYLWVKSQLEGLDRGRYVNVFVFCHHSPFSSGPHSLSVEDSTQTLRSRYMPLFHAHHVRAILAGHEHLYEHWVEHYIDNSGPHRMDFVVSGGGGAPLYPHMREPDLSAYLEANRGLKLQLQHRVTPGPVGSLSPHHFVVVQVDGDDVSLEFHSVDAASKFHPYPRDRTDLQDTR